METIPPHLLFLLGIEWEGDMFVSDLWYNFVSVAIQLQLA